MYFSVCPAPDNVTYATRSPDKPTYLVGDTLIYNCNGRLIANPAEVMSTCNLNNTGDPNWSLNANLPQCGELLN